MSYDDGMAEKGPGSATKRGTLLGLLFFAATTTGALAVLLCWPPARRRPANAPSETAAVSPRLFENRPAPRALSPAGAPSDASSLDLIVGASGPGRTAVAGRASATPAPAASPPAAAAPGEHDAEKALGEQGGPKTPTEASKLGSTRGMISSLSRRLMRHPTLLRALFDNPAMVDAFMGREKVKRNCNDAGALKSYLMDSKNPDGLADDLPIVREFLADKEAAAAFAGSRMAQAISGCPSLAALSKDAGSVTQIALANPSLAGLVADPNVAAGLAANPSAQAAFQNVNSALSR